MMWNPATNQISLLNSRPNSVHRKYERFACTIRIGLKYLSTSHEAGVEYNKNARGLYCVLCTLTLDVITVNMMDTDILSNEKMLIFKLIVCSGWSKVTNLFYICQNIFKT